jgi:hypothetical protein
MSVYGVPQLTKLRALYCDISKGSEGLRRFVFNHVDAFKRQHPSVAWQFAVNRRGPQIHKPMVVAYYRSGFRKVVSMNNLSLEGVTMLMHHLHNSAGRPNPKHRKLPIEQQYRSIQGSWNPYLWVNDHAQEPMPQEDALAAAREDLEGSRQATRREHVYRDILKFSTIKEGYIRRSHITADAHLANIFLPPPKNAEQKLAQKRWMGQPLPRRRGKAKAKAKTRAPRPSLAP